MRILVIAHGFPPEAQGGAEIYAHAHAHALRDGGDEVLVLAREQRPDRDEYDVRTEERDGLRIVSVNNTFRRTRSFEETYKNDVISAIAERVIDDFQPDVAHIHHLTGLSTTIVGSLAVRGVPSFMTLHDYWLICHRGQLLDADYRVCDGPESHDPPGCRGCVGAAGAASAAAFVAARAVRAVGRTLSGPPANGGPDKARPTQELARRFAERLATIMSSPARAGERARARVAHMRRVCDSVTRFLAPSHFMRDRFVRFGVAADRITVSRYGFDHRPFAKLARVPSDVLRLGFVGSLMVSKAPHVLLEALDRLPAGRVSVDLFGAHADYHGDRSYRARLERLLNRAGVRSHGPIPHDRIADALASIDVLVVPSIWPENSPLVIQEAFLAGVPVVASRIGGIPEVVEDGRSGLLFDADRADDLARALQQMLDDRGRLDTLRAGIPPVRTIEDDVRSTRALYEKHLQSRARSSRAPQRTAAVVLNYRTPDQTRLAVKSLQASRKPFDHIIVVDNDEQNRGYSGGMNVGIRDALARGADAVLLVNSDVIVPPDCLTHLEGALAAHPRAGIAGPVVRVRSEPDRIESLGLSYVAATGRMRHLVPRDGASMETAATREVDGVSGCLMLVRREVFDAIGLLDEDFFFSFEDLAFCLAARRAGFSTMLAGSAVVYHEGSQSIGADSPRRLYFAARNHLLVAQRTDPSAGRAASWYRSASIVTLNVAHAIVRARGGSLSRRVGAVVRGTRDYARGRFGSEV